MNREVTRRLKANAAGIVCERTHQQIAEILALRGDRITAQRVAQIEQEALKKLRKLLEN